MLPYPSFPGPLGLVIVGFFLITVRSAVAQPNVAVSVTGGWTSELTSRSGYTFYPEVQVESKFVSFGRQTLSVGGSAYYGHWSTDYEVNFDHFRMHYSEGQHRTGLRLQITGEKMPLPLTLSVGAGRRFWSQDVTGKGGFGREIDIESQERQASTTAEAGLHVRIPVKLGVSVRGGVRWYMDVPYTLPEAERPVRDGARTYQLGLVYTFFKYTS